MPMLASAQKFGHINTQDLFQIMPEVNTVKVRLDSLNKEYETLLMGMQDEYQKKLQDYQAKEATMSESIKKIQQEDLISMQQRLQTTYQTAQQDVDKKQQEWLAPVHEKMAKAIKSVGEKKGFTYIFDSVATIYVGPDAVDVMADVKKELGIK